MTTYYKFVVAGLFALNIVQMRQVRMLLKSGNKIKDQRNDAMSALTEFIEIHETLSRVLCENDIELSDFDRVLYENNMARIMAILNEYAKDDK